MSGKGTPRARPALADAGRRRASLKELAAATGFSVTTVSMVMNGRAAAFNISAATRDRVQAAARELHYQPNLHARSLRSRTTGILGLIVPTLVNPFFGEMAQTFEQLARGDGRLPLISVTHFDPAEELSTVDWFLSQRAECVFTANPQALERISELCDRAGTTQIVLDAQESPRHTVTTDNRDAASVLTGRLLDSLTAAHRGGRVFFVGGMDHHQVTRLRLSGFRSALEARGLRFAPEQFVESPFEADAAYRRIRALFRSHDDIGGIFLNAMSPVDGLARFYPEAPERVSAVHYGAFDFYPLSLGGLVALRLLVVKQDPEGMMRRAYAVFASGQGDQPGKTQHAPYELVVTPAMRPFLQEGSAPARAPRSAARAGARPASPVHPR